MVYLGVPPKSPACLAAASPLQATQDYYLTFGAFQNYQAITQAQCHVAFFWCDDSCLSRFNSWIFLPISASRSLISVAPIALLITHFPRYLSPIMAFVTLKTGPVCLFFV